MTSEFGGNSYAAPVSYWVKSSPTGDLDIKVQPRLVTQSQNAQLASVYLGIKMEPIETLKICKYAELKSPKN